MSQTICAPPYGPSWVEKYFGFIHDGTIEMRTPTEDVVIAVPWNTVIRFYAPATDTSGFEETTGIDPEVLDQDAAEQVCRWFQQKHPELICWIGPRPPAPCPIVKP